MPRTTVSRSLNFLMRSRKPHHPSADGATMLVGQQIWPFQIEKELGRGAMGAVYRGLYPKTGQRVAIKVMLPGMGESESAQKRFEREAEILKKCNHRNIVKL